VALKSGLGVNRPANLCTTCTSEFYRLNAIFSPLIAWVYLHSLLHCELRRNLYTVR